MKKISPYKENASITPTRDGIEVSIPSKKNWFVIVFLLFWLGGWLMGEISVGKDILEGGKNQQGFMIFWLAGWTVGGAFAITTWLWNVAGKEILHFSQSAMTYTRAIGKLKISHEYDLAHIKDLRVTPIPSGFFGQRNNFEMLGLRGGPISFDYGAKTLRIGAGVDEAEAKKIVEEIKRIHRNL
jgi:hypothetical protein